PWILRIVLNGVFIQRTKLVSQPVKGIPQRFSPLLIPAGSSAGIAAAVASPPFHAVITAPGCVFNDLDFKFRWIPFQVLAIDRQVGSGIVFYLMEAVRKAHFSKMMMMAVCFAVCSDMNNFRIFVLLVNLFKEPLRKF